MKRVNQLMMGGTKNTHFEYQHECHKTQRYRWSIYNANFYLKAVARWTCCDRDDDEEEEWRKRQTAEISSMAIPRLFFFHARTACSTNRLAALERSAVDDTISIASWLGITSHIFYIQTNPKKKKNG